MRSSGGGCQKNILSRLVLPIGTKGCLLSRLPDPGQKSSSFCPGMAFPVGKPGQKRFPNRDKSRFFSSAASSGCSASAGSKGVTTPTTLS